MTSKKTIQEIKYEQLPWIEKYRPDGIDGLMLENKLKKSIKDMIKTKNIQNIILVGPPGVGKTSTIRCIAKELLGKYYSKYVLELNASDDRGTKSVQGTIINFCRTKLFYKEDDEDKYSKQKIIILDEADNMVEKAQHQIDLLMEQYKDKVRFAFTCNSSAPIIESIQSKCIILRYTRLNLDLVTSKLSKIAEKEKVSYDKGGLHAIANISNGDLRQAINIMQMIYNKIGKITEKEVSDSCDIPQPIIIKDIFDNCIKNNLPNAIKKTLELRENGYSGSDIMYGMFYTLKTELCKEIPEIKLIKIGECISYATYVISKGLDTNLQLIACLCDMIKKLN